MPRRPLIVATEARGSGLGRFVAELAGALQTAGADVRLLAPAGADAPPVVTFEPLPIRPSAGRRAKLVALLRQSHDLARAIRRRAGPDAPMLMVHLHPTLPTSLLPLLAARRAGARTALGLHDLYPHTPRFPRRLVPLEHALYRWAYRRFDLILTNNPEQTERLVREAGVPRGRVRTLFHGTFPVAGIRPMPADAAEARLLVFGSLRPNKRILESIAAVRCLRADGVPVRLRIAGAVRREDAAYWDRCRAAIPDGDPGFELEIGFVDEAALPHVYGEVDAFLCPYAGFDSQSGVSVSAASNGIPLIATAAARAPTMEAADPAWTAVDDRADAEAIADAIRRFLLVPRDRRIDAAAALRRRTMEETGWPRLARLYLEGMAEAGFWSQPSASR